MATRILERIEHTAIWIAAVVALGMAVVVTIARLMLPGIDQYRPEIEHWLSEFMKQPVAIRSISAQWTGWTPHLELQGIDLLSPVDGRSITSFGGLRFTIDPLTSLLRRTLVPAGLSIAGLELTLTRDANGAITIEGVGAQGSISSFRQNAFAYWLQQQPRLDVRSARITWNDRKSLLEPVVFSDVELRIRSDGRQRSISGSTRLPSEVGKAFNFVLEWNGDLLQKDWSGDLYTEGRGLNPTFLLNYQQWMGLRLADGAVDFRVWTHWNRAVAVQVDGDFTSQQVRLGIGAHAIRFGAVSGRLFARRDAPRSWHLGIDKLQLTTDAGRWPESTLGAALVFDADGGLEGLVADASFLRIDDLAPLVPYVEALPEATRSALMGLAPRGELSQIRLGYFPSRPPERRLLLETQFQNIAVSPWQRVPGMRGLDGHLRVRNDGGELALDASGVHVSLPQQFAAPLPVSVMRGEVSFARRAATWIASSPGLVLRNDDFGVEISGSAQLGEDAVPLLDIVGRIERGALRSLPKYLPRNVLLPHTEHWIRMALVDGLLTGGGFALRGRIDQFPFASGNGLFEAHAAMRQATLRYSEHWPQLERVDGELAFKGSGVTFALARGSLLGAALTPSRAVVTDLRAAEKSVVIEAGARTTLESVRAIVRASPLADHLGSRLTDLALAGSFPLALKLEVPLEPERKSTVSGDIDLEGQDLTLHGTIIEQARGRVHFTRDGWHTEALSGLYRDMPIAIVGSNGYDGQAREIRFEGTADAATLAARLADFTPGLHHWLLQHDLYAHMTGAISWVARAPLPDARTANDADSVRRIVIESDLRGLALDAPAPLGRSPEESRLFQITLERHGPHLSTALIDYAGLLSARLRYVARDDGDRLDAAHVRFGTGPAPIPQAPGITVDGSLEMLPSSAWLALLDTPPRGPARAATASDTASLPVSVDLSVGHLEALGQGFDAVLLRVARTSGDWSIDVAARDIAGRISVPRSPGGSAVTATFDRLLLQKPDDAGPRHRPDPRTIPPMQVSCQRFAFDGIELGALALHTRPDANGLALDELSFTSPTATIRASGAWTYLDELHRSRFEINAEAPDLGRMLNTFGYARDAIQGGRTGITIRATWAGTPADFTLQRLSGTLSMVIKEGRFLDIEPGQGRLFGLISLQTLPRRLSLDFSDLFEKGFAFDRIDGQFTLDDGNAYTNNLVMDGPAARVEVTGRTGLKTQDYDQRASVTPKFSSTLPVASALFGPIGAAVGGVLLLGQEVFKGLPRQIDRMLGARYAITGSWNSPVISRIAGDADRTASGASGAPVESAETPRDPG